MTKKFHYKSRYTFFYTFGQFIISVDVLTVLVYYYYWHWQTFLYGSPFWKTYYRIAITYIFIACCISLYSLIVHLKRDKENGDIRITEEGFFYWDGWFEHQFKWAHMSEIRTTGAENNILKIFFKGNIQDYFRSPKSNNFIRNYCRKKLIDKNISIELKRFREKESLEMMMLDKKKIIL